MGIYVFVVQMRWIAVRRDLTWMNMDRYGLGRCWRIVFTLTFDSSPIKGEGDSVGCLACCCPALWIDESWMMFFEHLCFHPKGVSVLYFSSQ